MSRSFHIRVPCTSANIGPGFDVVGLSLSLYLFLDVTIEADAPHKDPVLTYSGQGAADAPLNPYQNLITRVALYVMRVNDIKSFPRGVRIHVRNDIPFGRGLGSQAPPSSQASCSATSSASCTSTATASSTTPS